MHAKVYCNTVQDIRWLVLWKEKQTDLPAGKLFSHHSKQLTQGSYTHFPHKARISSRLWACCLDFHQLSSMQSWTMAWYDVWKTVQLMFHSSDQPLSDWLMNAALLLVSNVAFCPCEHAKIDLFQVYCQHYSPGSFEELELDICPEFGPFFLSFLTQCGEIRECMNASLEQKNKTVLCHFQAENEWLSTNKNGNKSASMEMGWISRLFFQEGQLLEK